MIFQISSAVPLDKRKSYHSYLIRCWVSTQPAPGNDSRAHFVVESIAAQPQRWGFDTLEDLVAFLQVTLLEDEPEQRDNTPPNDAGRCPVVRWRQLYRHADNRRRAGAKDRIRLRVHPCGQRRAAMDYRFSGASD